MTASGGQGRRCVSCGECYGTGVLFCPTDGSSTVPEQYALSADPYVGRIVAGQFRVERLLGAGAMARVYLAEQLAEQRPVALKILHRALLHDRGAQARLRREATIGGRLRHPHVAQVLLLGSVDASAGQPGGEPFIALEYLHGLPLSTLLRARGGALGIAPALRIATQICEALGEAHVLGIVHRDLKPDNVMLVERGADANFVKVLDFGMARADADPDFSTRDGAVLGSARYMAPEAAQGGSAGPEADVYAIATLLFECIAGSTPFVGPSAVTVLVQQVSATPPDLRSVGAGRAASAALAALIAKNLAKDPGARCPSARAFGAELNAYLLAAEQHENGQDPFNRAPPH